MAATHDNPGWVEEIEWDLLTPPSRPSRANLLFIAETLQRLDRSQPVGVLGSTPEFRDLVFELGFQNVALLDKNLGFLEQMSRARVHQSPETLIEGDWRETLPKNRERFAVLLSDLTSGNIPYEGRRSFYRAIAESLLPGGLFLDRVLQHTPTMLLPLPELRAYYEAAPLNLAEVNRFNCEVFFRSELLRQDETVNIARFSEALLESWDSERLRRFLRAALRITPRNGVWWYGRSWDAIATDYESSFVLLKAQSEPPTSAYSDIGQLRIMVRAT